MKVMVYTFERTEGGIIAVIDSSNVSAIRNINSAWNNGNNTMVDLLNGAGFGFKPSSFDSFLVEESTEEEMVELRKAMINGDIDSQGIKLIGVE